MKDGKITVFAPRAEKAIGTITVKFDKEAEIENIKVVTGAALEAEDVAKIIAKFTRSEDKTTFTATINSSFDFIISKASKVEVYVKGVAEPYVVELEVVDVTVENIGAEPVDAGVAGQWNVTVTKENLAKAFGEFEDTAEFTLTLGNQVKTLGNTGEYWEITDETMLGAMKLEDVLPAVITLKVE